MSLTRCEIITLMKRQQATGIKKMPVKTPSIKTDSMSDSCCSDKPKRRPSISGESSVSHHFDRRASVSSTHRIIDSIPSKLLREGGKSSVKSKKRYDESCSKNSVNIDNCENVEIPHNDYKTEDAKEQRELEFSERSRTFSDLSESTESIEDADTICDEFSLRDDGSAESVISVISRRSVKSCKSSTSVKSTKSRASVRSYLSARSYLSVRSQASAGSYISCAALVPSRDLIPVVSEENDAVHLEKVHEMIKYGIDNKNGGFNDSGRLSRSAGGSSFSGVITYLGGGTGETPFCIQ